MSEDDKTHQPPRGPAPARPSSAIQITPGAVLKGTWRVDAELGSGGMGTVFLATHLGLEKRMAVKVLSPRAVSSPENLARFEREAKVAGKVSHPSMTHVIDFGVEQGTPYIVMEYVDGMELAEMIERQGPMQPRQAVAVTRQIVSLLHAAHALGIVHRDLKPSNIKVVQAGLDGQIFVKVLDFGIAKVVGDSAGQLTSTGMLVGTPAYMAPEQISGQPIDGRTDLYATGLIFHEMLSGVRAYQGDTIARILHAQLNEPPPLVPLPLPDVVRQTLQKFYEKRPEARFQDAAEADRALMACEEALRSFSGGVAVPKVPPPAGDARAPATAPGGLSATMQRPEAGAAQGAAPAPGTVSATMQRSEVGAAQRVAPAPGTFSATMQRPELEIAESRAPAVVPAPARPVTDRQPAPAPRAPAPAPAPKKAQPPVKSSLLGRGCLVALLGVGFLGCLGLGGLLMWAMEHQNLESAEEEAGHATDSFSEPPRRKREKPHREPAMPVEAPQEPEPPELAEPVPPRQVAPAPRHRTRPVSGPGCYITRAFFQSSGGPEGPWEYGTISTRDPIDCDSFEKGLSAEAQELADEWRIDEEVLQVKPVAPPQPDPEDPDTWWLELGVYTRVSAEAP